MRIIKLSRVMPALLTRIVTAPKSSWICFIQLSTDSASDTLSTYPLPELPAAARYSEIAAAPFSLVAVPTTVAPCAARFSAIALPMPRVAPVTSAILFSRLIAIPYAFSSSSALARPATSPILAISRARSTFLFRPERTLPGPHSIKVSTPVACIACTDSVQRTGL